MVTVYLTLTSFGVFVLDSKSKVVVEQLAYPDADLASSNIMAINGGSPPDSLKAVLKSLDELKDRLREKGYLDENGGDAATEAESEEE